MGIIATALLLAAAAHAQPPRWARLESDRSALFHSVAAPDTSKLTPEQLACQPDVIEGFKKIFAQASYGSVDTEAALRIDFVQGQREILISPQTHQFKKMEVPITPATIAIAHTHPGGNFRPSPQDEASPVPNFVVTRWALWVTDPHPAKHQPHSRPVRGWDWQKPCKAAN